MIISDLQHIGSAIETEVNGGILPGGCYQPGDFGTQPCPPKPKDCGTDPIILPPGGGCWQPRSGTK